MGKRKRLQGRFFHANPKHHRQTKSSSIFGLSQNVNKTCFCLILCLIHFSISSNLISSNITHRPSSCDLPQLWAPFRPPGSGTALLGCLPPGRARAARCTARWRTPKPPNHNLPKDRDTKIDVKRRFKKTTYSIFGAKKQAIVCYSHL